MQSPLQEFDVNLLPEDKTTPRAKRMALRRRRLRRTYDPRSTLENTIPTDVFEVDENIMPVSKKIQKISPSVAENTPPARSLDMECERQNLVQDIPLFGAVKSIMFWEKKMPSCFCFFTGSLFLHSRMLIGLNTYALLCRTVGSIIIMTFCGRFIDSKR
jgi:hypothetical protein